MKSAAKMKPTTCTLNGQRAFYLREENTISNAPQREKGKVRGLTVVDLFAGAGGFTVGSSRSSQKQKTICKAFICPGTLLERSHANA